MKKKVFALVIAFMFFSLLAYDGQAINKNSNLGKVQTYARFEPRRGYIKETAYQPSQIKNAYGINKLNATGKNQKIAIVTAYGSSTIKNDLTSFNSKFGLSTADLQVFYPQGTVAANDSGWAEETSLDVEWAHALAPDAAIYLVVAKSDSTTDLLNAVDYASNLGVQVVSMSWGISEFSGEVNLDSHFQHSGIVYVAASGDNGAGVVWPAASPNVLAVGGTTLRLDGSGNLKGNETAWTGSGGGISKFEKEPSYQKSLNIKSNSHRAIPDVAFCADPNTGVMVYYNSAWYTVGGTSFSTPAWAAFISLIDENRTTSLYNAQNQLYNIANSSAYYSNFRDITIGRNGYVPIDNARNGYDFVTGLGTPLENSLYNNLAASK